MRNPFVTIHEDAISFRELTDFGWTSEQYFNYCGYCAWIRAILIEDSLGHKKQDSEIQECVDRLFRWLESSTGVWFQIDYDMVYSLRTQIRYFSEEEMKHHGLPNLFRSEEDFRCVLEEHITLALSNTEPATIEIGPICETKEKAERLYAELQEEVERILDSLEIGKLDFGNQEELYSWARNAEKKLEIVRDLEERMLSLDSRLEELENGAEFDPKVNTLYVCKGTIRCERLSHHIISVTAAIPDINGKIRKINVNYCLDCKLFFISYSEYLHYIEKYGALIAKFVLVESWESGDFTSSLAQESPLKLCGYSASQEVGYSQEQREYLLSKLMDNGVISKPDIIRYLSWFIRVNGERFGNEIAREKWKSDLNFTRNYEIQRQDEHPIHDIRRYPGANKVGVK